MRSEADRQKLALGASVANKAIAGVVGVLMIPLYLRHLTAEEYGIWLMVLGITSYLGLANFGISQTVGNHVAAKWQQRHNRIPLIEIVSSAWVAYNVITLGIICALGLAGLLYLRFSSIEHELILPLALAAIGFAIVLPWQIFSVSLRSSGRIFQEQFFSAGSSLLRFLLVAGALAVGYKLIALALINTVALGAPRVAAWLHMRKSSPWFQVSWRHAKWQVSRQLFKPSASFFVIQIAGLLAFSTDNLVIGATLGPEHIPAYAVPMQFVLLSISVVTLFSVNSFPTISRLYATGQPNQLKNFILQLASAQYISGAVLIVFTWIFGQSFITHWATPALAPEGLLFGGLAAFAVIQIIIAPLDAVVMATSNHRVFSYAAIAEGLLNLGLSLAAVSTYGIGGIVWATVISRAVSLVTLSIITGRVIDYPISYYLAVVAVFLIFPCGMVIGLAQGQSLELPDGLWNLTFLKLFLFLIVIVLFLVMLRRRLFRRPALLT